MDPGKPTTDVRDAVQVDEPITEMNGAVDADGPTMDARDEHDMAADKTTPDARSVRDAVDIGHPTTDASEVGAATTRMCGAGVTTNARECRAVGAALVVGAAGTTDVDEIGRDRTEAMTSTHETGRCSRARPMMVESRL